MRTSFPGYYSARVAKPKPKRPGPEERNLAPEQFPELNRQFYSAPLQPHAYLRHRWRSLFLEAQPPDRLPRAFDAELRIGDLSTSWATPENDWEDPELRDYLSTESTVLLHHASEALFRLYFAHTDSPECPWLAVARLRLPAQFKERLSLFMSEAGTAAAAASVMNIFYGHPEPNEANVERWTDIKDGSMMLLRHLGRRLQTEGPLYNSAKHGLALVPGPAAMALGDRNGPLPIRAEGPSITYLTVKEGQNGKRWAQETVWLDAEKNLALTHFATTAIGNLWRVARHRYIGEGWDEAKMQFIGKELIRRVLEMRQPENEVTINVPSMSMELLYYADN